jgi:mannose-6-phosphate isomerase-like protein (cupin superfamily)
MFISNMEECPEFIAGDETRLREILHPGQADLAISYSLSHAIVSPGQITLAHRLKGSEVYFILEGTGLMRIGQDEQRVGPGQAVYIPPGAVQSIANTGDSDLQFLCIVDPAWRAADEEIL